MSTYTTSPVLPLGQKVTTPAGPGTVTRVGTVHDDTTALPMVAVTLVGGTTQIFRGLATYKVEVAA